MEQGNGDSESRSRRKLLIVDDEAKINHVLAQHFALNGYDVRTARRADEAITAAGSFQPHVVLLDLMMPGTSGVNTLKELKQITPSSKILILSAIDNETIIKDTLRLGADFYVCKPFNFAELDQVVDRFSSG